ncbi:helix-turn-helix domain-containing protein [Sporosarcina gallistercoris]|uniref:Helix-turn-helix transcriptional regulator n=1 Tax=Sporosarcina gallistercoris TaxID=2762245 RepID=A0ABR8PIG1_9BACL|nr:helix-turn-helix transcriptional regulator [Sporosarcina gallistercoris]MBD7907962.1 helix-turn-helix transcriptional regulator [Sporosarcina gallistercoris]
MNDWSKEGFGIRLKELREQRGLSMMAFGAAIGTSASRIKDWEKGKNAPSAAWVAKISERFNISTDELILGDSKKSPAFKQANTASAESLYERLRETITVDGFSDEQDEEADRLYAELDASNKTRYRSGKGRRLAERELLNLLTGLPKKDVLELLELAKLKCRLQKTSETK